MRLHKPCRYAACLEHGIASLGDEDLCCDHFVLRSYEFLEQVDAQRARKGGHFGGAALESTVTGCLQGALEVALRAESLDNLQKARLMDILLWAGELANGADSGRFRGTGNAAFSIAERNATRRKVYFKPQVKQRGGILPQ